MDSGIGVLDVHVHADAGQVDAAREFAPGFVREVLERCDELLRARHGPRCVMHRALETRWRVTAEYVRRPDAVDSIALELADGIDAEVAAGGSDIVNFRDPVAFRAAYLIALADGRGDAWYFAPLIAQGPFGTGGHTSVDADEIEATLLDVAEQGHLAAVLQALDPSTLDTVAQQCDVIALLVQAEDAPPDSAAIEVSIDASELARLSPAARAILILIEARRACGTGAPASAVRAVAARALRRHGTAPAVSARGGSGVDAGNANGAPRTREEDLFIRTELAGLFYLLPLSLELSLGEILWKACVDERACLAHAAAVLTGRSIEDDPALSMFGGMVADAPLDDLDDERATEIAQQVLRAVQDAFPRRGLAAAPRLECYVSGQQRNRLFVATPAGSPFAIFAAPAATRAELEAAVQRMLEVWPASRPPFAHPALADADPTRRLRPSIALPLARDLLVASHADPRCAAVLTQVAGVLASLFGARVGAPESLDAASFVARYFAVPGRLRWDRQVLTVTVPSDRTDLEVRRAGLDRDPGWVPWLQAMVRIEFEGTAEPD